MSPDDRLKTNVKSNFETPLRKGENSHRHLMDSLASAYRTRTKTKVNFDPSMPKLSPSGRSAADITKIRSPALKSNFHSTSFNNMVSGASSPSKSGRKNIESSFISMRYLEDSKISFNCPTPSSMMKNRHSFCGSFQPGRLKSPGVLKKLDLSS